MGNWSYKPYKWSEISPYLYRDPGGPPCIPPKSHACRYLSRQQTNRDIELFLDARFHHP